MRSIPILVAVLALVLAGCGSSNKNAGSGSGASTSSSGGGGEQLSLAAPADGSIKFDKTTLTAKAGKVTLEMSNPSQLPHAVAIKGNGVDVDGKTVGNGETSTASTDLKPGTYTFYCPVPGHEAAGMKGTLTVN